MDHLRLSVAVWLGGHGNDDCLNLLVCGTAEACVRRIELETVMRLPAAAYGFCLIFELEGQPLYRTLLTPSRLIETCIWGSSRLNVHVQLLRRKGDPSEHGHWIHLAASKVQRQWRAHRSWCLRVDATDVLHTFTWAVRRKGLRLLHPEPLRLLGGEAGEPPARGEAMLLRLALVLAACRPGGAAAGRRAEGPGAARLFRWLEVRIVSFCVHQAAEYSTGLDGLAEPPRCFGALKALTLGLLKRLGLVLPWLLEISVMEEVQRVAEEAAVAAARACRGMGTAAAQQLFVARVHSQVLGWVLDSAQGSVHDLERHFEDAHLAARVMEMPCIQDVEAVIASLHVAPKWWLVRLESSEGPMILLPLQRGEHFGGIFRSACLLYGLEYLQLFTSGPDPLNVEETPEAIMPQGVVLPVRVHPCSPDPRSFERAVMEITKALGSRFRLERPLRLLRLPARPEACAAAAGGAPEEPPPLPGDMLLLPEAYGGEAQYYHVYDSSLRRLTTLRCPLSHILERLRPQGLRGVGHRGGRPGWRISAIEEVAAAPLLRELESLQEQVRPWVDRAVARRPMRCCGSLHMFDLRRVPDTALSLWTGWASQQDRPAAVKDQNQANAERKRLLRSTRAPANSTRSGAGDNSDVASEESQMKWRQAFDFIGGHASHLKNLLAGSLSADSKTQAHSAAKGSSATGSTHGSRSSSRSADLGAEVDSQPRVPHFTGHAPLVGSRVKLNIQEGGSSSSTDHCKARREPQRSAPDDSARAASRGCRTNAVTRQDERLWSKSEHRPSTESLNGETEASSDPMADLDPEKLKLAHVGTDVHLTNLALAAAVCTAKFVAAQPRMEPRWVLRQVERISGNQVLLAPALSQVIDAKLTAGSGAIAGAALGSLFGPLGFGFGAVGGFLATGKAEGLILAKPNVVTLGEGHHHVLSRSLADGSMYLAHNEVPRPMSTGNAALAVLTQASVRGLLNMCAFARDEMSGKDVAVALARDLRDGVVVWATCQGALMGVVLGQQHGSAALSHLCGLVLHNPALVMFGAMGAGRIAYRCLQYSLDSVSMEQFQADVVVTGSQNSASIFTNIIGDLFQVSLLSRMLLTCASSQLAGIWAHHAWAEMRRKEAEAKLHGIALEVMGLAPSHSLEQLRCRWRTLARYSHPDRNRRPDAKQTFAIFSLCRDVLQDRARGGRCPPPGAFVGLARRLRRCRWAARGDVPGAGALAGRSSQPRPGRIPQAGGCGSPGLAPPLRCDGRAEAPREARGRRQDGLRHPNAGSTAKSMSSQGHGTSSTADCHMHQ